MEEGGALWANDPPATPKRAGGAKAKAKTIEADADNGDTGGVESGNATATATPKAKVKAKSPAKTPGSGAKRGRKAKESDTDGEEAAKEDESPTKKVKTTLEPIDEERDAIDENIKNEPDGAEAANGKVEDDAEIDAELDANGSG
jgi:hypothetical protein